MLKGHEADYISSRLREHIRRRYTYAFSDENGKLEVSVANFPGNSSRMLVEPDCVTGGAPVMNFRRIEWQINY